MHTIVQYKEAVLAYAILLKEENGQVCQLFLLIKLLCLQLSANPSYDIAFQVKHKSCVTFLVPGYFSANCWRKM